MTHQRDIDRIRKGAGRNRSRRGKKQRKGEEAHHFLVEIKWHYLISLCVQSYLVFDVVALWPSQGLVSPCFTDPKTGSSQVGGIDHGSNSRSVFY